MIGRALACLNRDRRVVWAACRVLSALPRGLASDGLRRRLADAVWDEVLRKAGRPGDHRPHTLTDLAGISRREATHGA